MQTFEPQTPRIRFLYNQLHSKAFQQWIPLILIVILGTVLRLYQIGTESIWIDEGFSIRDAENLRLKLRVFYYLFLLLLPPLGYEILYIYILFYSYFLNFIFSLSFSILISVFSFY